MKKCTNCQNIYNDNMNYCPNCGSQLISSNQHFADSLPKTNCPYCSKSIPINSEYCEFCGIRIAPYICGSANENHARNSYQPQPNNFAYASFIIALLSILSLCASPAFSIIMCIIAFVLAVSATNVKYEKKNGFVITSLVISIIMCFISFCVIIIDSSDDDAIDRTNSVYTTEQVSESEITTESETSALPVIEEQIIYDDNDVIMKIMGCEYSRNDFEIAVYIENNSTLNLGFNARAYSVNGIMTNNNIYDMDCDVAAGKKANTILEIDSAFLRDYDIQQIKTIDVLFWAYDNDACFKEFDTNQITIHTSLDDGSLSMISGETIFENDQIRIDFLDNTKKEFNYCFTNKSGKYLAFDLENLSINEYTSSNTDFDLIGVIVLNDCQTFFTVKPDDEFLSLNSISNINSIEFTLNIRPEEDYSHHWNTEKIIKNFD